MDDFAGRLAVVTGGGSGMGRELVLQLAAEGCSVATCDVRVEAAEATARLAEQAAPAGTRVTVHACDVSNPADVDRFRDEVVAEHGRDHINLLFNNAGVGGGGSFLTGDRGEWERTFGICWGGVYACCRAFAPLLVASDSGYLVNTSSVNGFWALLAPGIPHTAYSAAKFAVKGFTEALIEDFRLNAPHVKAAVVMPGHIGTDIVMNSRLVHAGSGDGGAVVSRADLARQGMPVDDMTDQQVAEVLEAFAAMFRDGAPMTAAQAATVILDGVRAGRWRILVGDDAVALDEKVRADPEGAYGDGAFSLGGALSG